MICPNCKNTIKDESKFCGYCGADIEQETATAEKRLKKAGIIGSIVVLVLIFLIVFAVVYCYCIVPATNYKKAKGLYANGDYIAAAEAMGALDGYKDSKRLEADYYFEAKEYIKAAECYRYLPNCTQEYNQSRYNYALELFDSKQYSEAITEFTHLDGFEDSTKYIEKCNIELLKSSSPGYTFEFGTYEQDNNAENGKEAITWIVAKNEGNKLLLVSSKVLDCQIFTNSTQTYMKWPNTYLRSWLNSTFYDTAFNSKEKKKILLSGIATKDYELGNSFSNDYVFVMSDDEYDELKSVSGLSHPLVTDYAKAQDDKDDDISNGWASWYLRDQRKFSGYIGYHYAPGSVDNKGITYYVFAGDHTGGVRPCIWFDLSDANDTENTTQSTTTAKFTYYVTANSLNVRLGPGYDYETIGTLYIGDMVEVLAVKDGWCRILYEGAEAYVSADYVSELVPTR